MGLVRFLLLQLLLGLQLRPPGSSCLPGELQCVLRGIVPTDTEVLRASLCLCHGVRIRPHRDVELHNHSVEFSHLSHSELWDDQERIHAVTSVHVVHHAVCCGCQPEGQEKARG